MPIYTYACEKGHEFERFLIVTDYAQPQTCSCGAASTKVMTPPIVFVSQTIHYTSPIDGRPVTSMQARRQDLARSQCVEYDPGMKQDYQRRIVEDEKRLDKAVDQTVDKAIAEMPARKREKLESELINADVEPVRLTRTTNG